MAPLAVLVKSRQFLSPRHFKSISSFIHLNQEAQLAEPSTTKETPTPPPLPPNPSSGSPRYNENWRSPVSAPSATDGSLISIGLGFLNQTHVGRIQLLSHSIDAASLMNQFAGWMTSQNWEDIKQLFEFWVRALDKNGKPNEPDVNIYNHYLRANFMIGASAGELLDLVAQIDGFGIFPNTATYNLVLKAMQRDGETLAAVKLIERMLQTGREYKESLPDEESFDIVIGMLLSTNQIDSALKYIDLTLKSGYMLSMDAFVNCVQRCVNNAKLDTLVSIIERCQKMDENKSLCPPWRVCNYLADIAMQSDNNALTFHALRFLRKWICRGEVANPPVQLCVEEGLIVSALGTAGRTYSSVLVEGSWGVLTQSSRKRKVPNPETYLGKIYAYSNLGNLKKAFDTLHELEKTHGSSDQEDGEDLFSPFYSLNPLVVAFSNNGFATLDAVYYQLENLRQADPPLKSLAALNCVILGCAKIWDLDRAYQTFNSIDATFGLTPNIHSYNALICAFGKLSMRDEAVKVLEHFVGSGVKANATTYSLIIDTHLIKRDPQAALSVINEMILAGYEPSKEILKKVRRRCMREIDYESDDKVNSLAKQFKIRMGSEARRDLLFNLQYSTGSGSYEASRT